MMPKDLKTIFLNVHEFLHCSETELADISHIYFANQNIHSILQEEEQQQSFLARLRLCINLTKFNLQQCKLTDDDVLYIHDALCCAPIRYINLRRNNKISVDTIINIEAQLQRRNPDVIVIAFGALSRPNAYVAPYDNVTLADGCCELEIMEMLDIADEILKRQPYLRKAHAFRESSPKKKPLDPITEIQTNLPWSVAFNGSTAYLLPKLESAPVQITDFNKLTANRYADLLRDTTRPIRVIKIGIHKSNTRNNQLAFSVLKSSLAITACPTLEPYLKREARFWRNTGILAFYFKRQYNASINSRFPFKAYTSMPLYSGVDSFDILNNMVQEYPMQNPSAPGDDYPNLHVDTKTISLTIVLQTMLHLMLLNSRNTVHRDVKPENVIVDISKQKDNQLHIKVRVVDLEGAMTEHEDLSSSLRLHNRYTIGYVSPEILNDSHRSLNVANDAYSCGILARQFLFPCCATIPGKGAYFLINPEQQRNSTFNIQELLSKHFSKGIQHNYGATVANVIQGLTHMNHTQRKTLPEALLSIASVLPEAAMNAYQEISNIVKEQLDFILIQYPTAKSFLNELTPEVAEDWNPSTKIDIKALNMLLKLQHLVCFMQLFLYCNGTLPDAATTILKKHLTLLLTRPDILSMPALSKNFYADAEILGLIAEYSDSMDFIAHAFKDAAIAMLKSGQPATEPVVQQTLKIQTDIWQMWQDKAGIAKILCFAQQEFNNILADSTLNVGLKATLSARIQEPLTKMAAVVAPPTANKRQCISPQIGV